MEHTNPLGTAKISSLLVKYSVPAIIGMLVNAVYNIVDRIFIEIQQNWVQNGLAELRWLFL
jgi:Na+-driven multidrug efflux pump